VNHSISGTTEAIEAYQEGIRDLGPKHFDVRHFMWAEDAQHAPASVAQVEQAIAAGRDWTACAFGMLSVLDALGRISYSTGVAIPPSGIAHPGYWQNIGVGDWNLADAYHERRALGDDDRTAQWGAMLELCDRELKERANAGRP
jgi:hypothetical protein